MQTPSIHMRAQYYGIPFETIIDLYYEYLMPKIIKLMPPIICVVPSIINFYVLT